MITLGAAVYLSCSLSDNKIAGAVLFSLALMVICMLDMYLFTGKIGLLVEDFSKTNLISIFVGITTNYITATLGGLLLGFAKPELAEKAKTMCQTKLEYSWYIAIILGIFCGILMYTGVKSYAVTKQPLILIFCVSAFILSGFEHSIADMAYFGIAGMFSLKKTGFIVLVLIGNAIGGMLIPALMKGVKANEK